MSCGMRWRFAGSRAQGHTKNSPNTKIPFWSLTVFRQMLVKNKKMISALPRCSVMAVFSHDSFCADSCSTKGQLLTVPSKE